MSGLRDLEEWVGRVPDADVRPLVKEAYRAYTAGAARAAIVLTWTAVCADLIGKIRQLHEEGEGDAKPLVQQVESAQGHLDATAVRTMQKVEDSLLDTALTLELIDASQKLQLQRLREDRNMCAHPSLRPLGELFDPQPEYARAHLAAALDAVLVHPASQGRKSMQAFTNHVTDPGFVGDPVHIAQVFYYRVRPTSRRRITDLAAKHALLELPADGITDSELADRMATCLRVFAAQEHDLVRNAITRAAQRLLTAPTPVQLRAAGRMGDLEPFWSGTDEPMHSQLDALIRTVGATHAEESAWHKMLSPDELQALALATDPRVRATLPSLEKAFTDLPAHKRAAVIAQSPSTYFAEHLAALMADAGGFDHGESLARTAVLPCASYLTHDQLQALLSAWEENPQCWGRLMPYYLVSLYQATSHLGDSRKKLWRQLLESLDQERPAYAVIAAAIEETPETATEE
ncbi:hypothetical protein [Streptomyces pactum]|uniref:hypothetical protein n=1 Tax=Streptomyces pactum TaxID=68249 RepID=UPI0006E23BB7|nr:hypothetical protein [Streptomyces pactum]